MINSCQTATAIAAQRVPARSLSCSNACATAMRAPAARLPPLVYDELRALAASYMRGERANHTPETARALGVSGRTVEDDWTMAKAWLKQRIREG